MRKRRIGFVETLEPAAGKENHKRMIDATLDMLETRHFSGFLWITPLRTPVAQAFLISPRYATLDFAGFGQRGL